MTAHTIYRKDYQPADYFIETIDLDFSLNDEDTIVIARMQFKKRDPQSTNPLVLNGESLILEALKLNDNVLPATQYTTTKHDLTIHSLPASGLLEIITRIFPAKNTALSGLYRSGKTYCTQCEAEGFRHITYFLDRPDVLACFTTKITADLSRYPILLSNGNLIESGKLPDGRHWVKWQDPFKKPCYLFALVAGDFDLLEDHFITESKHDVLLQVYVEKGYGDQAHHAMQSLKDAMKWDEDTFGREYDLNRYMIVAIGDFNMGAMENKGLNIFNTKYILAKPSTATDEDYVHVKTVIGHEYFHNWTGNRVTCRDWFQLSLKEGLTIFREHAFAEDSFSRAVMRIRDVRYLRETQFIEDAGPLAHPVRPDAYLEINNFYTTTIYEKGAEVLRMLQTILGRAQFRQGMDLYFSQFDGQAVTIEDFVKTMEKVSGIDLMQFRLWYAQSGTPIVTIHSQYDAAQKRYTLTCAQVTLPTPDQPEKQALVIPIQVGLLNLSGQAVAERLLMLSQATQSFTFDNVPEKPIPSLLRHFSAPVKLKYDYTDEELVFLFKHDQDAFNRWEAGQQFFVRVLLQLMSSSHGTAKPRNNADICEMFQYVLTQPIIDPLFVAELLSLPSEKYLAEQMTVIEVDAIHAARESVRLSLAQQLEPLFLKHYHELDKNEAYVFDTRRMGERQLKNLCLSYLMLLPQHATLGMQQLQHNLQSNMTDTQAALATLVNVNSPLRKQALDQFYTVWQHDALVVDKWFAIQATSKLTTVGEVKALMQHPAFDIKNPNKVYALVGAFAARNATQFHVKSGEGYVWLRECVEQLNSLNPQVAARMVQPLTTFKRYDAERQQLILQQLKLLLQNKTLSKDVYELVQKSVGVS